ncbi:MAG: hypothetical protein ACT4OJ_15865 [Bacteroidota bacterium]
MTQRDNILQELNELGSQLANSTPQNVYAVPAGYFEGLIAQVMDRIKAVEAISAADELSHLSPLLSGLSKKIPYSLPIDYFEGLDEKMMQGVRNSSDYQTVSEETESISPLLAGLNKEMPYNVPQGYFENLAADITVKENKQEAKIISISSRRWFRYAAAAVVTGVIVMAGFMIFKPNVDPVEQPYVWVKKSVKKVDLKEIDAFVKLVDENLSNQKEVAVNPVSSEEIKELMKDVSDKEIQDFLNETPETESSDEETLMN